jgi:hypothetical protein
MTMLCFSDFSDFDQKMSQYLKSQDLPDQLLKTCKMQALEQYVLSLDMQDEGDAAQMPYLMWHMM